MAALAVPLIAIANNMGSLPLLICSIILTLLAICAYRTMTVAVVADITPRPLRTKANSIQKVVGYAGTGLMLVAISVMVPKVERPDYLPLFILQGVFILAAAAVYGLFVREPGLVQKMREKSLEMGIDEDEIDKDDSPEAGGKEKVTDRSLQLSLIHICVRPEAWHCWAASLRARSTASAMDSKGATRTLTLARATGGRTLWAGEPSI